MIQILVIEDEKRVADLLKIGLEENGYQVMIAYDGEMGWRLYLSNNFQLVISDIILPKLNGFELCQRIRQIDEQTPILMLTALGTADDKLEGFDTGADDYMVKPFDFRELVASKSAAEETYCRKDRSCQRDFIRRPHYPLRASGSNKEGRTH